MTLKQRVYWRARMFVAAASLVLFWVSLGMPIAWATLEALPLPSWAHPTAVTLLALVTSALGAIPGDHAKACIVFLRRRHPLPGCRAFEKSRLAKDPRIDQERLRIALGGTFPRTASEQNSTWFRLYESLRADPRIEGIHFEYLLFRDLTWLSLLFFSTAVFGAALIQSNGFALLVVAGAFLALIVLFRQAASERGERFVNTVLAIWSARQ